MRPYVPPRSDEQVSHSQRDICVAPWGQRAGTAARLPIIHPCNLQFGTSGRVMCNVARVALHGSGGGGGDRGNGLLGGGQGGESLS